MEAIVFTEANKVTSMEIDDPVVGAYDVIVDVKASGICHTDIEILKGNYGSSAFPLAPGHEFAGAISAIGSNVTDFKVGDRVVVDPNLECGECRSCKKGWAHLCENLGAYGVSVNGGFAEKCVVDVSAIHSIEDLPFELAALAEPLGCVLNGLDAAQVERAENALIFGAGPIGLLLAIAMRQAGVTEVMMVDIEQSRLDFAESLGFKSFMSGSAELDKYHQAIDLVTDATGVTAVAGSLINYVANGGVALFFGVAPADERIEVSPFEIFRRQITLAGCHSLNHNIPEALEVVKANRETLSQLVSHRLSMQEISKTFEEGMPKNCLKVQWSNL